MILKFLEGHEMALEVYLGMFGEGCDWVEGKRVWDVGRVCGGR